MTMESDEPTRYARQQEKIRKIERHAEIVRKLGAEPINNFERTMLGLTKPTPCIAAGLPSRWTDWDENPDNREDYEGAMPTAKEAWDMCQGCPLMEDDKCYTFALATNKQHGVWGGRRFLNGNVVSDGRDSTDVPNRLKYH